MLVFIFDLSPRNCYPGNLLRFVSKMPKVLHRSLSPKNGERLVCCKQGDLIIYQLEVAPVYFRPTNHNWGLYHNHTVWCRGIMHIYDVIWCGVPADPCQCGLVTLCWYEKPWNIKMHVMINRKPATDWLNMFGWFNAQQMMLNNNYALMHHFLGYRALGYSDTSNSNTAKQS